MPTATIEERLIAVEKKLDQLLEKPLPKTETIPWWESIAGSFANSPDYDEAMKRGRSYRESLRPMDTVGSSEGPVN